MSISIQPNDFDIAAELAALRASSAKAGTLLPNEQIVMVATASEHRADAFAACEFIMDYLKTAAPFWKKEQTALGTQWLETRASDVQRMKHWNE